jgi:hypothetical protein
MTINSRPSRRSFIARILILALVVTLALPGSALTGPGSTSLSSWSESAMAARGKKHNKDANRKRRQPRTTTITRTVRGPLTRTFTSSGPLAIPAAGTGEGPASPYPSTIEVSGFTSGVITDVDLVLQDFTHVEPGQVDVLLVKEDGRRALVMSDAARTISPEANIDLTLDDEAAASLPEIGPVDSGVFRPTNYGNPDLFAAPAPAPDGSVALSTFDGTNPNGTWQLFVMDDDGILDVGDMRGWALRITAEVDLATVDEQVRAGKDAKRGQKGKGKRTRR